MELKSVSVLKITAQEKVFSDRKRTNILRNGEQRLILSLLKKVPLSITPNGMTFIGMIGSFVVFSSFILAIYFGRIYLSIGLIGLAINWIGDSLDGRLAYFREIPRKWYGFALDIMMDWLSIILIGLGYYYYESTTARVLGFLFVVLYGWSMIISLLRYKITGQYQIDSGNLGPTELRVIIGLFLLIEIAFPTSITYLAAAITILLLVINITESIKILKLGDIKDKEFKEK